MVSGWLVRMTITDYLKKNSVILPDGRVMFSLRESDIETYGFSDIIFAYKLAKRITLCEAQ